MGVGGGVGVRMGWGCKGGGGRVGREGARIGKWGFDIFFFVFSLGSGLRLFFSLSWLIVLESFLILAMLLVHITVSRLGIESVWTRMG